MTTPRPISENTRREIEVRAYHIWEREGRPPGREHEHWVLAETEILGSAPIKPRDPGGNAKAPTAKSAGATNGGAKSPKAVAAAKAAAPAEKAKAGKAKKAAKPKPGRSS